MRMRLLYADGIEGSLDLEWLALRVRPRLKKIVATLIEQMVNASIVAGIAALSLMVAQQESILKPVVIAFGLTFLLEMRKYRRL